MSQKPAAPLLTAAEEKSTRKIGRNIREIRKRFFHLPDGIQRELVLRLGIECGAIVTVPREVTDG